MNNGYSAVSYRVRVDIARLAVRCPACMTYACGSSEVRFVPELFDKTVLEFSFCFDGFYPVALKYGYACGVIAPVFKLRERIYKYCGAFFCTDISYYSTHKFIPPFVNRSLYIRDIRYKILF